MSRKITFFFSCHYDVLFDSLSLIHFQCQTKLKHNIHQFSNQNLLSKQKTKGKKGLGLRMSSGVRPQGKDNELNCEQ